jgi:hypothetical protein
MPTTTIGGCQTTLAKSVIDAKNAFTFFSDVIIAVFVV